MVGRYLPNTKLPKSSKGYQRPTVISTKLITNHNAIHQCVCANRVFNLSSSKFLLCKSMIPTSPHP